MSIEQLFICPNFERYSHQQSTRTIFIKILPGFILCFKNYFLTRTCEFSITLEMKCMAKWWILKWWCIIGVWSCVYYNVTKSPTRRKRVKSRGTVLTEKKCVRCQCVIIDVSMRKSFTNNTQSSRRRTQLTQNMCNPFTIN